MYGRAKLLHVNEKNEKIFNGFKNRQRAEFLRRFGSGLMVEDPKIASSTKQSTLPKKKRLKTISKASAFYKSYEWRKLRYTTLLKYGRKCMCCGVEKGVFNVDHIKPLRKYWELRLDPDNVQVLCKECNHGKGNWDETDHRPP